METDKEAILNDIPLDETGHREFFTKKEVYQAMDTYAASLLKENEELQRRVIELQQADMTHEYNNAEAERVWPQIKQQIIDEANEAKEKEIEILKGLIEEYEERENDPYWYWGQCDVDECMGVSCNGGGCWKDTGYWKVCLKHSAEFREGKPQPKMKQSAIEREASRDKETGRLP